MLSGRVEADLRAMTLGNDPLTGLPDVHQLWWHLEREVARSERYGRPLSLALLDLDDFAGINRRHGRAVGDLVLAVVGDRLRSFVRPSDLVGRPLEDEFVVILPETGEDEARACVERLRLELAVLEVPPVRGVHASSGVAEWKPGETPTRLLSHASRRLSGARG
jgi:diguanylate cyclase (GGDEF)-like protein